MEITSTNQTSTKETLLNSVHQSDSGILSATGTSLSTDGEDQPNQGTSSTSDTDNRSSCSSPGCKYLCPICETMLTSQHDFTLHIRSHNNDSSEVQDSDKGYICRICSKVLSSSASLDRHVLIHSGERPFTCKYCGDTFTTNGNMHRHMRTHSSKTDNYESDGSSDSGASADSKSVEYNNNKINSYKQADRKRKISGFDEDAESVKISRSELDSDVGEKYICPVCERDDFASIEMLELHLGDNHPDYPAKCRQCNQFFKNNKMLCEHRHLTHCGEENGKNLKNSVVGFKDLTFVDFSSQKFPYIARYECEKNLHKVSGSLRFQCSKCSRAFPCSSSLEIHQADCSSTGLDLSTVGKNSSSVTPESDIRRADFFARLDLQNNCKYEKPEANDAVLPKIPNRAHPILLQEVTKDLADIQSIISMTNNNGTLLQQLQGKPNEIPSPPKHDVDSTKNDNEEETQDLFAAEFRKMKLRGEFPCRLCTAIFPNLRALKGHNRAHLNGNNNGTYRCNMCPHSSLDKAALIRHMRTHNGDRPYECSLCNYAFTTKANCERHLRNRHSKTTREEVKKSIIYHPSEDPSNEEISKMLSRDEINATHPVLVNNNIDNNEEKTPKHFQIVPDMAKLIREKKIPNNICRESPLARSNLEEKFSIKIPTPEAFPQHSTIAAETHEVTPPRNVFSSETSFPYFPHLFNFTPNAADTSTPRKVLPQAIHVKKIDDLKDANDDSVKPEYSNEDSMDVVLDLSKKKSEEEPPPIQKYEENAPQDLTTKAASALQPNVNEFLAQHLLKNAPKIDPTSIYASQLAFWNRNGFPGLSTMPNLPAWPFSFNPLLFQAIPNQLLSQDPQEIKERIRNLQLCGGGMVIDNVAERLKSFQQQTNPPSFSTFKINDSAKPAMPLHENHYKNPQISTEDVKPLSLNVDSGFSENMMKMHSPVQMPKPDVMSSPNSVKMVIKNGVLMPKQKQRRYRTERPFSCEYCSARFTLRSNMERHIKQQHPQYWSQRQRSAIGGPGRKSHAAATSPKSGYCNLTVPSYESPKAKSYDEIKATSIPDKIKYAILSQHLKAAKTNATETPKEEDEDYPLVIDEIDDTSRKSEDQNHKPSNSNETCEDLSTPKVSDDSPTDLSAAASATKIIQASLMSRSEDAQDLVPVSRLLDNASQQPFKEYFQRDGDCRDAGFSEEDEEGLVASSSTSDGNNSGTDENR